MPKEPNIDRTSHLAETDVIETSSGGIRRGMCLITAGSEAGRAFRIEAGQASSIGRGQGCTVVVDDSGLSRIHAEFLRVGDDYAVRDAGSTNGTFVNDARIDYVRHLAEGDRIRIGTSTRLRFSLVDEAEESALLRLHETTTRAAAMLEVAGGTARPAPSPKALGGTAVVLDPAMRALYEQAHRAAQAPISVLLLGETGVGKEVLARAIHLASPRAARSFLALHCAALSEALLEAELFGHEKGAFTGAMQAREGLFEAADGGTVFLDEVGELPASVQVKLLRVLEDRKVMRVGARSQRAIDVRFIAATNRDLEADVTRGVFRQDLFFRLNGIALTIPPLRDRRGEIPQLAELFLDQSARQLGRKPPPISADALEVLCRHAWPGNVRELRNALDRAIVLCVGDKILPEHLPPKIARTPSSPPPAASGGTRPQLLRHELLSLEKQRILDTIEACGGNQTHAAERLGMSRRTLVARLQEWGLTRPKHRPRG